MRSILRAAFRVLRTLGERVESESLEGFKEMALTIPSH